MHLESALAERGVRVRHPIDLLADGAAVTGLTAIADRLEAIVEELDEIAFDRLRQAAADGATERPASDRQITRARRSVEKAAAVLRSVDD